MSAAKAPEPAGRDPERIAAALALLSKAADMLGLSQQIAQRCAAMLGHHNEQTLDVVCTMAPLLDGAGPNSVWSVEAAALARERGKPVTLLHSVSGRRTDIEIMTGKWTVQLTN